MSLLRLVGIFFSALAIGRGRYGARVVRRAGIRAEGPLGTYARTVRAAAQGRSGRRYARRMIVRGIR